MSPAVAPNLVDFHCHLDLYPDFEALIAECEEARIFTLGVTTTPAAWPRNHELTRVTRHVRTALGLHPQLVAERASEIELWDQYLPEARYVGEVGLDSGPKYYKSLPKQKEVFEHVLRRCARAGNKILTVHSVRSVTPVLDMVEQHLANTDNRVVLHWFTGTRKEALRAAQLGCYFSVNGTMLSKPVGREFVTSLPLARLLTETDGPFTRSGAEVARPSDVLATVDQLAVLRGTDRDEVTRLVRANLRDLISD
jgi:TatD DNase family protein